MLNWRIQSWSARALTLAFSLLLYINLTAQDVVPTKGTEFWVGFMDNFDSSESLDLFITSNEATSGSVSIPQMDWSFDFDVNANETTTVTVPSNLAVHADENQIISNRGVLVETEDTVSVFAINFRQFTSDGTKILPTRALGTDYRVTSYTGLTGAGSELLVVATEDNTEIEIIPSVITGGGNPAGVPFTVQLNRGQSYQIFQNESSYDLTGTIVRATESSGLCRPFAVFSGVSCANIPVGCTYCDHICEQNFPTTAWGMEYYLVPYAFATGVTYRVLAQENGTEIYVNGSLVSTLDAGQFYENNHVNSPTCIQSSLPVSVVQFMQGTSCSSLGDPAMLFLNDATQKIDNVTFSTVISNQITNHGVNLVMATEDIATLTLDGEQVDINEFSQFPSCPENSYAQLSISPGSHTLDAPNGFTAYSFGLGNAESYSYSVGSFSPNPFNIELEEVYCTDEQVVLTLDEPSFDAFWYHFDFPEDTLSFESSLVLDVPVVNGVYVVEFNSSVSGCEQVQYYSVESPEPPAVNVNPENVTICQYENTQLSLNPSPPNSFYNYSWTPELGLSNSTISNPVASPLTSTTYTYTVTSPTGCSSASGEVDVTVEGGDYSNLKIYSTENDICIGQSVDLYALIEEIRFYDDFDLGIQSSLWSEIANGNLGNACGSVSGEGLYFNNSGLRSATTIPIDVALGGTINFALHYGESTFPCDQVDAGEDVILEYSIDGIYWHEVQVLYNFLQSGWEQYSFEVPILAQTSNTQFRWRQLANTGTNQDNWTLDNVAISATITENSELNWFHNDELIDSNTSMITVFPEQDEQYFVEFEDLDAGCVYSDSIWIAASHAFELEISPDTAICNLEEVQLSVLASSPDAYEYLWTPSDGSISTETSSSPIVSPISSITYYVQVTSNQGCVNHADVTVSVSPPLELSINSSATEICQGDMLELSADLAENPDHLSYTWEATPLIEIPAQSDVTLNPNQSTNLTVLVTDTLTECSVNESFFIEVYGDFTVNAGADTLLCNAENFNLNATASNQGTYTWSWMPSAEVLDYQSASTSVLSNVSNEFIITADENGCFQRDTILVTSVFEDLNLGPDLEICDGDSLTLSSGYPNASHSWSTGENLESIIVSEENLYSVTLTSEIGCSISDELEVLVLESPNVNLGPDLNLCQGVIQCRVYQKTLRYVKMNF